MAKVEVEIKLDGASPEGLQALAEVFMMVVQPTAQPMTEVERAFNAWLSSAAPKTRLIVNCIREQGKVSSASLAMYLGLRGRRYGAALGAAAKTIKQAFGVLPYERIRSGRVTTHYQWVGFPRDVETSS